MKIISDKELIKRRVALQDLLVEETLKFTVAIDHLDLMINRLNSDEEVQRKELQSKIQTLAVIYFELQYGEFFYKLDSKSRNKIIDLVSKRYVDEIKGKQINDLNQYSLRTIFVYLDNALAETTKR